MLLIGTETILFGSLISAYQVLRMSAPMWPPEGVPVLKPGLSVFNTLVLLAGWTVAVLAVRTARTDSRVALRRRLQGLAGLTVLFIGLQGAEFARSSLQGITLKTGVYGALFYSLIACHALHMIGGLGFVAWFLIRLHRASSQSVQEWTSLVQMYWYFVTAAWLVLFSILYLI